MDNYDELSDILHAYYNDGVMDIDEDIFEDKNHRNIFRSMVHIVDELKEFDIRSDDFTNSGNLGFNDKGRLCYFDIGFGNHSEEFDTHPEQIPLNELSLGLDRGVLSKLFRKYGGDSKSVMLGDGGMFGAAYDMGDGTVLKLTVDKTEAVNSKKLVGRDTKYLARIYDVKYITVRDEKFYVIHLEKLRIDDRLREVLVRMNEVILENMDGCFDVGIIAMIARKHPVVAGALSCLYKEGESNFWQKYKETAENLREYDFNDVVQISRWIKGSKTNDNDCRDGVPDAVEEAVLNFLK